MDKAQVIIVGAGPTGLMAANLLGQAGIDTLVIERHAGLSEEARAITIDDEGLRICQTIGLADTICKQARLNIGASYVSQRRLLVRVAPQHQPNGYPLISTFYQPDFETTLLQGLKRFPSVNIRFRHTVEAIKQNEDGVILTVRTVDDTREHLQCAYLLACDGGKSGLRQTLGITLRSPHLHDLFYAPSSATLLQALREYLIDITRTLSRLRRSSCSIYVYFFYILQAVLAKCKKSKHIYYKSFSKLSCTILFIKKVDMRGIKHALTKFNRGVHPKRKEHATQRWLVIDYKDHSKQSEQIIFYCNPARPAVSVQAPGQRKRWEFMLKPGERDEDLLHEEAIASMIKQAEATLPKGLHAARNTDEQIQIERKVIYKFYATIASTFASGRVFLLGDAAHLMPPFGGQGMNSGLRDAHNLCWKLKLVIEGRASQHLLASYQQERYIHAARMITFSSLLGKLIMPTNPLLAWARDHFIRIIGHIPFVQTQLSDMRVRPQPRYRQGFLLPAKGSKLVGRLLPQPYIIQNGTRICLDETLGNSFTVLRLYEKPDEAFIGFEGEVWTRLNLRRVCVLPQWIKEEKLSNQPTRPLPSASQRHRFIARRPASDGELLHISPNHFQFLPPTGPVPTQTYQDSKNLEAIENSKPIKQEIIRDCDGVLAEFLDSRQDLLVLVRPDRYILGVFHVEQVKDVERAVQDLQVQGA